MDRCKKRSNPTPPPAQPRDASARAAVGIQQGARKTPPPSSGADRSQAQRLPPAQPHPQPQEPRGRTTTPSLPPTTPPAQQGTASGPRPPAVPTEAAAPELPRVQAQNHRLELPAPRKGSEALKLHPPRQPVPQAGKKPRENVRSPWGKLSKGEKKQEVPPAPGLRKPAVQRLSWVPSSPSGTKSNDPEASAPRRRSGSTAHPPSSEVPSSSVDSPAQRAGVKEGPAEAGGTTKGPAATGTSRGRSGRPVSTSAKRPAVPPGGGATELSRFAADSRGRPPALPFSEARGTAHAAAKMTLPSSRSQGDPGKSTTEDEEHEGPGRASDIVRPRASHAMGHRSPGTSGAMGQQGARLHGMRERASASPGFSEFSRASLSRGGGGARVAVSSGRRRPADPPGGNGWPAEAKKTGSAPQGQRVALRGAEEGKRPGVEFPSPRSSGETVATPGQAAAGGKRGPQPRQAPRSSQAPPSPGNSSKRPSTSAGKHQLPATNRRSTVLAGPLRSQGVAEGLPGNTRPGLALEVSGGAYLGSSPAPKTPSQKPTTLFQRQLEELFSKPPRSKCLSDDSGVVPSPEAPDQKAPRTKGLAPTASQATVLCPASPLLRSLQPSSSSKRRQIARKADWHLLGGSMDPYGVLARGTSRQSERGRTRGLGSASESLRRQLQKIADSYDAAGRADAPGHRPNISLSRTHTLSQYAAVPAGL